jgi:hypothetical protein
MGGACSTFGEMRNAYKILVPESGGKRLFGRLGVDWIIIVKWILENRVEGCELDSDSDSWFRTGTLKGSCEHVNEPSGSIKGEEFLD